MIKTTYANAYKEVLVILDNLIKEDYNKIPKEYIEFLKLNCNNEYEFYYDNSKTFEEQEKVLINYLTREEKDMYLAIQVSDLMDTDGNAEYELAKLMR